MSRRWARATIAAVVVAAAVVTVSAATHDSRQSAGQPGSSGAARAEPGASRPTVVDSSLPLDEALRRFRDGLPVVERLSGVARTREALVRSFIRAVEQRDTAAIRSMTLSRAEFAYLYYLDSPFTKEPHKQMIGPVWFLTQANSSKGITRVFDRLGGRELGYLSHRCDSNPRTQGANLVWESCTVRLSQVAGGSELRLFGSIVERGGRVKFVSYANDF